MFGPPGLSHFEAKNVILQNQEVPLYILTTVYVAYVSSAYYHCLSIMIYCTLDEPVSIGLRQAHQYSKHALTLGRSELVNPHMSPSLAHVGPK